MMAEESGAGTSFGGGEVGGEAGRTVTGSATRFTIRGEIAQTARLELAPGERVWASKGSIMAHTAGVQWVLRVPGGLEGVVRRSLSGEGVALAHITTQAPGQEVLLASNRPGHILEWYLADGPVVTTRGSFLAAWGPEIQIDVTVAKRAGAALFGGAGLFLQKIQGNGSVLVHGSGDFHRQQLREGESVLVSTGNLAAFAEDLDYDIKRVSGARRILFGGEGLFMTRLTGPGLVYLQSLKRDT